MGLSLNARLGIGCEMQIRRSFTWTLTFLSEGVCGERIPRAVGKEGKWSFWTSKAVEVVILLRKKRGDICCHSCIFLDTGVRAVKVLVFSRDDDFGHLGCMCA